jgi:hypothetical protein
MIDAYLTSGSSPGRANLDLTLSMAYRIWYRSQRQGVAAAVEQVLSTLSQVLCQDGMRRLKHGRRKVSDAIHV